jgi:hypothetical protein
MELLQILEIGVSGRRRDTQFSGVRIKWNNTLPTGERICDVSVGDESLDLERTYIFATSDYLAMGAIGYGILEEMSEKRGSMVGTIRQAVMDYVKTHSPLKIKIEGRNLFSDMHEMTEEMKAFHQRIKDKQAGETEDSGAEENQPPKYYNL